MSEIPVHSRPRRLADWINPTGAKKVHSLIDKVYKRKNLEMAWERVRPTGVAEEWMGRVWRPCAQLDQQLDRLQKELKEETYQPQPVRQVQIPKAGKPGEFRMLGIPTIYDRVCQQALLNRLEPIFEPVFDDANFGYRRGRSTKDAMRKVWKEIESGREWIVDADLKDFFGSVDHEKLLTLVAQRIADGRVLRLIKAMLKAGSYGKGRLFPTERGTPQGGVVSPLLSNILLTPFDREMRRKGYQLTRFADDWVVTCKSAAEARAAVVAARRILEQLGVQLHPQKTRMVHVRHGFEFLGYKIKRGQRRCGFRPARFVAGAQRARCMRTRARNRFGVSWIRCGAHQAARTAENPGADCGAEPVIARVGQLLQASPCPKALPPARRLDLRRIWSHRYKRWRSAGWKQVPEARLYGEYGLVNLVQLIPSLAPASRVFVKAACGKTARAV